MAAFLNYPTPPYSNVAPVTPSNSDQLANPGIIVAAGAGNVAIPTVAMADDATPVVIAVAAGAPLLVPVKQVMSTSTTATGIAVMWP